MFEQKLYKNGSSVVVTVPKQLLKKHNLRDGSRVVLGDEKGAITITPRKKQNASAPNGKHITLTPEFKGWLDEVVRNEEKLIRELAKR